MRGVAVIRRRTLALVSTVAVQPSAAIVTPARPAVSSCPNRATAQGGRRGARRRRGVAPAVWRPVEGTERVAAFLSRLSQVAPGADVATLLINGAVAARIDPARELDAALTFVVEDGRIMRIYVIRNPHKLRRLEDAAELRR